MIEPEMTIPSLTALSFIEKELALFFSSQIPIPRICEARPAR
jgi:hypothetical protein